MRIGIDIDDVITNTSEVVEAYVAKDKNCVILQKHMREIMKGTPLISEAIEFGKNNYLKIFQEVRIKENAKRVIKDLQNKGNEVYLITARGNRINHFKGSEEVTKKFLKDNEIQYSEIIFNAIDKAKLCVENNIDLMIDDSTEHCEEVNNIGVKSILFTTNVNKNIDTKIERVSNWIELEKTINNIIIK